MCLRMFAFGQERARARGLILADTKYELGPRARRADPLHRRDPHARLVALLVPRGLRAAGRARRGAALARQGVRAPLVRRAWATHGEGTPPPIPDEVRVEAARRYIEAYETVTGARSSPTRRTRSRESGGTSGSPDDGRGADRWNPGWRVAASEPVLRRRSSSARPSLTTSRWSVESAAAEMVSPNGPAAHCFAASDAPHPTPRFPRRPRSHGTEREDTVELSRR